MRQANICYYINILDQQLSRHLAYVPAAAAAHQIFRCRYTIHTSWFINYLRKQKLIISNLVLWTIKSCTWKCNINFFDTR